MAPRITKREPIEGLVAGIVTERELAINIGSQQGVKPGMKFQVMANTPTEIRDPETGEELGTFIREKVRVRATTVEPRYSICRTYKVSTVSGGLGAAAADAANFLEPERRIPETLKADDAAYLPELPEEDSFVNKGDRVVELLENDE